MHFRLGWTLEVTMTLIATLLMALTSLLGVPVGFAAGTLDANDLRDEQNQALFNEEEMGRVGQRGHCPHG
jgi:hypothetical protein